MPASQHQRTRAGARWCPEEEASWLSRLTFAYVEGLLRKGKTKALVMDDLWDVAESDRAADVAAKFQVRTAMRIEPIHSQAQALSQAQQGCPRDCRAYSHVLGDVGGGHGSAVAAKSQARPLTSTRHGWDAGSGRFVLVLCAGCCACSACASAVCSAEVLEGTRDELKAHQGLAWCAGWAGQCACCACCVSALCAAGGAGGHAG